MSITTYLQQILAARYGKDVRQSIHDAIEEGYNIAVAAQDVAQTSQESAEAYAAAALASEQAAQNYMNQAEQYKDEAFSGTPTGYADLVAKVNSIYQETASSFGVVGTVEGLALAHTIYGMSEQDGTPTPSVPVDIDSAVANFKCVGKNLIPYPYYHSNGQVAYDVTFNVSNDGGITPNGTASASGLGFRVIGGHGTDMNPLLKIKPNQAYIISGTPSGSGTSASNYKLRYTYIFYNDNGDTVSQGYVYESDVTVTAPLTASKFRIVIDVVKNVVYDGNITCYPMLTLVDANQTYELYQSKSITTDLTLRAIEVTSSDNYNLVKDGKYYIADTLDWDEDSGYSITRRIGEWLLDGSEDENYMIGTINYDCFIALDNLYNLSGANAVTKAKTNRFSTAVSRNDFYNSEKSNYNAFITTFSNTFQAPCFAFRVNGVTSVDLLRTWLSENNVVLVYRLATPTSETVTSAQAQALLGLKTYDEATSIDSTGDVAPNVTLEYSKDRNTALALIGHNMAHINALKIADLSV